MNKEEAKVIVRANLKGKKKKEAPLLVIAEAVRLLTSDPEYGSTTKLADSFDVKRPTIDAFDKMNDQPSEIKKLIADGKIGIDTNAKLASVDEIDRRIALANAVAGLRASDQREIIAKCKKDHNLEPEKCKKTITNSKPAKKLEKSLTIHLGINEYEEFSRKSKNAGLPIGEAGRNAILEWASKQKVNMG